MKTPSNIKTIPFARRYNLALEKAKLIKFDSFCLWDELEDLVPEKDDRLIMIVSEEETAAAVSSTNLLLSLIIYTVQTQANDSSRDAFFMKTLLDRYALDLEQATNYFRMYIEVADSSVVYTHKFALIIKELIQAQNN